MTIATHCRRCGAAYEATEEDVIRGESSGAGPGSLALMTPQQNRYKTGTKAVPTRSTGRPETMAQDRPQTAHSSITPCQRHHLMSTR